MANFTDQLNNKLSGSQASKLGPNVRFSGNAFIKADAEKQSFAEQLSAMKFENKEDLVQQIIKHAQEGKTGEEIFSALKANPETLELFKSGQKTLLAKYESLKQESQELAADTSKGHAEEIAKKLKPNETVIAAVGQVNSKQAEEEMVKQKAKQDAVVDDANDRKKQLASWHSLAPRIMEDVKLKAVRVDIPGIDDLHTLIVKSVGSKNVRIDVVGSEAAMNLLKSKQGELQSRLNKHEINLTDLRTYFSDKKTTKTKENTNV